MSEDISVLRSHAIDPENVNREIAKLWPQLVESGELRRAAEEAGVDASKLEKSGIPFVAGRPEGQFGIAETLVIAALTGAATEFGKTALRTLWESLLWPRLRRHFGAQLEEVP